MDQEQFRAEHGIKVHPRDSDEAKARPCSRLERSFLGYYLPSMNGELAARAVKRGGKNPGKWASAVVRRPHVRAEIERRLAALEASQAASYEAMVEEYRQHAFKPHEGPWLASHKLQAMRDLSNLKGWLKPETAVQAAVSFTFVGSPRHTDQVASESDTLGTPLITVDKPEPR
jgi:hypothetical protein